MVAPGPGKFTGKPTDAIVETVDIFPTICDLAGLAPPANLPGTSLRPHLKDPGAPGHSLIRHSKGGKATHLELYDHEKDPGEIENIAGAMPDLARDLGRKLDARLK